MNIIYKIKFHTYWHCGSGLAAGADADLLVIKDKNGFPYVPGKTVKGLIREAVDLLDPAIQSSDDYKRVFGISEGNRNKENGNRSDSFFKDATLQDKEQKFIVQNNLTQHLYQNISGTAIEDDGTAKDNSLRKIQVTIPCVLEGEIIDVPKGMVDAVSDAMKYIKRLGAWRNRGLGRCSFEEIETNELEVLPVENNSHAGARNLLKFRCKLLTDVVLNQKSASEGANSTLDFIPGSNFLGIAAAGIYQDPSIGQDIKLKLFHTEFVRYGDAHPANGLNRSLRMPACLFFAKGEDEKGRSHYVHHEIKDVTSEELRKIQLKQERTGYVDFLPLNEGKEAKRFKVKTDFAIKSAYDRKLRRSLDENMFGYQSMGKGLTYYFSVEIDSSLSDYAERIKTELEGIHRIGRSRSAQYGLVEISECDYSEVESNKNVVKSGELLVVYADSRLIFLDDDNIPTFQPNSKQITGNETDEILWDKSQLRTFQYAPYNYQRRCFDTDRCGIEKGSVIVVKVTKDTDVSSLNSHLGSYQNEGFGKVIYNPDFLKVEGNGLLAYKIEPKEDVENEEVIDPNTILTNFLAGREKIRKEEAEIYKAVNEWVNKDRIRVYAKESFASQWGNIRNIALQCSTSDQLIDKLFRIKGVDGKVLPEHEKGYLVHGVAKDKWAGKSQALKDFINSHSPKAVVNLASEMQKKCK